MLLEVLDANGNARTIITNGQETVVDQSGVFVEGAVFQEAMAANDERSGFFFQNRSGEPMYIQESLEQPTTNDDAVEVLPGDSFPLPGVPYPVTTLPIWVAGQAEGKYVAKEW